MVMKPFEFFRRASATAAVAPLPIPTHFQQRLDPLLHSLVLPQLPISAEWFVDALRASSAAHTIALDSLKAVAFRYSDRIVIERYLESDNVTSLDACNQLSEKMEIVQEYVKSLMVVSHLLQAAGKFELPNPTTLARALELLDSSFKSMERRFGETSNSTNCNNSRSRLMRKMSSSKKVVVVDADCSEYGEILNGSMAVASMVCGMLGTALSFKAKRCAHSMSTLRSLHEFQKQLMKGHKGGKNSSMMLPELQQTVSLARELQSHIRLRNKSEVKIVGEELKSRCEDLEEKIMGLKEGVRELYKHLISVRMALLGMSQA